MHVYRLIQIHNTHAYTYISRHTQTHKHSHVTRAYAHVHVGLYSIQVGPTHTHMNTHNNTGLSMGGDLALSLGGRKKLMGPNFRMTFLGKNFHFTSKNLG